MLDELREYREYTWDQDSEENRIERIKYGVLTRGGRFTGLERVLTIIARHFLYYYEDRTTSRDRNAAFAALYAWLGLDGAVYEKELDPERKAEIDAIRGWFPRYLDEVMQYCDRKEKDPEERKEKVKERQEFLRSYEFYKMVSLSCYQNGIGETGHSRTMRLDKAVANGMCRKRLKRFYLVCRDPRFEEVSLGADMKKSLADDRKPALKRRDMLLRLIAAYLVENYYSAPSVSDPDPDRFVYFSLPALSNWCRYQDGYQHRAFDHFYYNGRRLIEKFGEDRYKHNNRTKIRFNKEWFDKCGWRLIEAADNDDELDEYLKEHPGACFYRDDGAGEGLVRGLRYERSVI